MLNVKLLLIVETTLDYYYFVPLRQVPNIHINILFTQYLEPKRSLRLHSPLLAQLLHPWWSALQLLLHPLL